MMRLVPSSDRSRATEVKAYKFQENPLTNHVYVWVSSGNPNNPDERDGRVGSQSMEELGLRLPAGEVGGGHLWWRKGRIELGVYFVRERLEQSVAGDYAHEVLGRAMYWTERAEVSDLVDEFSEHALWIYVYGNTFYEGGGPKNQYYWRGEILYQVLTERPY